MPIAALTSMPTCENINTRYKINIHFIFSMTATSHAVIGTFIAARFIDPFASVPIAFVSHYLTDMVPHWDSSTNRVKKSERRHLIEASADGLASAAVSGVIYYYIFGLTNFDYLYLVVFFALLPDLITVFTRFILKKKSFLWDWNNKLQKRLNNKMQLPWGILTQIAVVGLIYIFLFRIFI